MAVIERCPRGAPRRVLLCHVMHRADVFSEPHRTRLCGPRWTRRPPVCHPGHAGEGDPRAAASSNAATASRDVGMNGARFGGHGGPGWTRTDRARVGHRDGPAPRQPVRHGGDLVVLAHLRRRRHGDRLAAPHREHGPVAVAERVRRVEDLDLPTAARDPAPRFAFARLAGKVHTRPTRSISSHDARRTAPIAPPCPLAGGSLSSMCGPCSDLVPRRPAPAYVRTLVPQGPVGAARPRRRQPRRHRPGCRGGPRARARRAFLPGRMHPERPPAGPGVRRTAPALVGAGSLTARKGVAQGNSDRSRGRPPGTSCFWLSACWNWT